MPSNKSSSLSSNPNPRSSEIGNPMRRSFTGNPFTNPSIVPNHGHKTPVNTPSDFPRTGSIGVRESGGSFRDSLDDKENGKDHILKPAKVRSPAVSSKGSKNFMSPTISASCKINESPRKRVLFERNETVLSPVDRKNNVPKVTSAEPLEEKRIDEIIPNFEGGRRSSLTSEDLSGSESKTHEIHNMNDTDLTFESVNGVNVNAPLILDYDIHTEPSFETKHDCVNLDPTFKLSPTFTPPVSLKATVVAPLDADPLLPPYDPKTNYLSPRPQFLHYKPKCLIQLCRERELEDSFLSGSFSDIEVTEDAQSESSQKESEDVSSDETLKEEEDKISEPIPDMGTLMPEETAEATQVPRSRFAVRAKAIALILLLGIAFVSISVTDSPVIDQTMFENFYKVYELSEISDFARANFDQFTLFAKTNFDEIARNLQIWFTKLLSSISEFISDVRGGAHSLAKLQYYNLSTQHDYSDSVVYQYPIFGRGKDEISETRAPAWDYEESNVTSDVENDADIEEEISTEHYEAYEQEVQEDIATTSGAENALDGPEFEKVLNMIESEQLPEAECLEAKLAQETEANLNIENQPSLNLEDTEMSIDRSDAKQSQENNGIFDVNEQSGDVSLDSAVNDDVAEEKSGIDAGIKGNEEQLEATDIPTDVVLYMLLGVGTVLIAGTAFNMSRGVKSKSSMEQHNNSVPSKKEQISGEKSSGPIVMDVVEEDSSCPSEASSFHSEKVVNEGHRPGSETKRKNNDYRTESLASSGSPSYGSLTVYEKIPIKQGIGEEEIITPVRRSSRIRNKATSPS